MVGSSISVIPLAVLVFAGADISWLWRGALAWGIAFVVKLPLVAGVAVLTSKSPGWLQALAAGVASSASELGIALIALARAEAMPPLVDIFLFAAAAGSAEALALLAWSRLVAPAQADKERWLERGATSWVVRHVFVLERSIAWAGHFGSRSLIALALVRQMPWLGVVAATTFTLTDAAAAYGHGIQVDWFAPPTLKRYARLAIILVGIELAVLVGYLLI